MGKSQNPDDTSPHPYIGETVSAYVSGERVPGLIQRVHSPDAGTKNYHEVTVVFFSRGDGMDSITVKYSTDDFESTWCYPGEAS